MSVSLFISFLFSDKKKKSIENLSTIFCTWPGNNGRRKKEKSKNDFHPKDFFFFLMPSTLNGACLDYARAVLVVVCVWSVILSDRDDAWRKKNKKAIYKGNLLSCPSGQGMIDQLLISHSSPGKHFQSISVVIITMMIIITKRRIHFFLSGILWWLSLLLLRR